MGNWVFRPPPQPQRALPSAILPAQVFDNPPIRTPSVAVLSMVVALWQPEWGPWPQLARPVTVPIASVQQIDNPPPYTRIPDAIYRAWQPKSSISLAGLAVPIEPQGDTSSSYVPLPWQIIQQWQPAWGPWPDVNRAVTQPVPTAADAPPFNGPGTGASDPNILAVIRAAWPEWLEPRLSQPQVGKRNIATTMLVFGDQPTVRSPGYYRWNVFIAWQPAWGPWPNQHGWLGSQTPPSQVGIVGDPPRVDMNLAAMMWAGFR